MPGKMDQVRKPASVCGYLRFEVYIIGKNFGTCEPDCADPRIRCALECATVEAIRDLPLQTVLFDLVLEGAAADAEELGCLRSILVGFV